MNNEAGSFSLISAPMSSYSVLLVIQGFADDDEAVLEDDGRVSEDEVNGAGDNAVTVELTVCLGIERVLVAVHSAVEEGRHVRLHSEGDGLVFFRARRVPKAH